MIFQLKNKLPGGKYMTFCSGDGRLCAVTELTWLDLARICSTANELTTFEGKPVQRKLNKARARKFANYLRERILAKERFVIPPIVITVIGPSLGWYDDNGIEWPKTGEEPKIYEPVYDGVGRQVLPAGATVVVNDGQHRVAGIRMLLNMTKKTKKNKDDPFVGYRIDNNSLVAQVQACFRPEDMQQMFTDINSTSSKPSKSLSLFFDKNNEFNAAVAELIETHPVLQDRTDVEKNTVGGKSPMVFTMAGLVSAFQEFFFLKAKDTKWTKAESDLARDVLNELGYLWELDRHGNYADAEDLREKSCAPHAVYLKGLLAAMADLIREKPDEWVQYLSAYGVPFSKDDPLLVNRCVTSDGKMIGGAHNVLLTTAAIKRHLGLSLGTSESLAEMKLDAQTLRDEEWAAYNKERKTK